MTEPEDAPSSSYQDALDKLMAFADEPAVGETTRITPQDWSNEDLEPSEDSEQEQAQLYFGSVDEFVREIISPLYRRKVGARGTRRWSAQWWRNAEAISRLEALWRAWEHLRLESATGMSTWWRDHADYHMNALFAPDGPFGASEDENKAGEPLPYAPPPPGLFSDARSR